MLWISLGLVVVLGGLTVWFHSETFIKWKPSALYWTMGLALCVSQLVFGKNLLRVLLGAQLHLPSAGVAAPELGLDRVLRRDGRAQPVGGVQLLDRRPGSTSSCSERSA